MCYNRLVNAEAGDISNLPVNESVIPNQRRNWTGFQIFVVYFFISWRALAETTRDTIMQQVTERFVQVATSDDDMDIDDGEDEDEMEEEDDDKDDDDLLGEADENEEDEEDDINDEESLSSTESYEIPMHSSTASHLRTRKFVLSMTRAREIWRGYDHNIKNAWREYANRLNQVGITGLLTTMPAVFEDHSSLVAGRPGGLESLIFTALYIDWKFLVQAKTNKVLLRGPSKKPATINRERNYGPHKIRTRTHIWKQDVPLPYLCYKFLLTGEIRNNRSTLIVKKTASRWIVHIASHQRMDELFTIDHNKKTRGKLIL